MSKSISTCIEAAWLIRTIEEISLDKNELVDIPDPTPQGKTPDQLAQSELVGYKVFKPVDVEKEPGLDEGIYFTLDIYHPTPPPCMQHYSVLAIQRALRPLKQMEPCPFHPPIIDVDETMLRIAKYRKESQDSKFNNNLWKLPAFIPQTEKWLHLILVVDRSSRSMDLFNEQVQTFKTAVEQSGIFRRISIINLKSKQGSVNNNAIPEFSIGHYPSEKIMSYQSVFLENNDQRIILFLSDCLSPVWENWYSNDKNGIGNIITEIAKKHSVSILQTMPEYYWRYSALGRYKKVFVNSNQIVKKNAHLIANRKSKQENDYYIPVFTLDENKIQQWANLIAGRNPCKTQSVIVSESDNQNFTTLKETNPPDIDKFCVYGSDSARKFAAYLSAVPLLKETIPVIWKTMLPNVKDWVFAELITSGIIQIENYQIKLNKEVTPENTNISNYIPHYKKLELQANLYDAIPILQIENRKFFDLYDELKKNGNYWLNGLDQNFNSKEQFLKYVHNNIVSYYKYIQEYQEQKISRGELYPSMQKDINIDVTKPGKDEVHNIPEMEKHENKPLQATPENKPIVEPGYIINHSSTEFIRLPAFHITLWGDTNCGKTSFIRSISKNLELSQNKYKFTELGHYGNKLNNFSFSRPEPVPTTDFDDSVYLLENNENKSSAIIFFHDMPGERTINQKHAEKTVFENSNAIFLCISLESLQEKGINSELSKQIQRFIKLRENQKSPVYICITKMDLDKNNIFSNFENQLSALGEFIGKGVLNFIQQLNPIIFWGSSYGRNQKEWLPENTSKPLIDFIESFENNKNNTQPKKGWFR